MKYLKQFAIILAVSFAGELLHSFIPLPIPASIYGIVILFLLLETGLVKLAQVRETGLFLISLMQLMFVPAVVGLIDVWDIVKQSWPAYLAIIVITTALVFGASGKATELMIKTIRRQEK